MEATMHKIVQANIDRYKSLLETETDPTKRALIAKLLEEGKTKQMASAVAKTKARGGWFSIQTRQCVGSISMSFFVEASIHPVSLLRQGNISA
jgi:hypothetical protein